MINRLMEVCSDAELVKAIKVAGEYLEARVATYGSLILADKAISILEQTLENIRKQRRIAARITDNSIGLAM